MPKIKPPKEELHKKYITENNSAKELCEIYNTKVWTIEKWLRDYSIKKDRKQAQKIAKKTKLEKYGDENYNNREKFKDAVRKRTLKQKADSNAKRKQTKLEKYGDENYTNHEKYMETCLERYGVTSASKNPEIAKKISESHLNRTDLQKAETKEKYKDTCLKKFGKESHNQSPEVIAKKLKAFEGKYKNGNIWREHLTNFNDFNLDFINKNFIKNERFLAKEFRDYFNTSSCFVSVFKKKHNIDAPSKSCFGESEDIFYNKLKEFLKGYAGEIRRQFLILNKRPDFYFTLEKPLEIDNVVLLKGAKIALEYLGDYHHGRSNTNEMTILNKTSAQLYFETFERFKFLLSSDKIDFICYVWHSDFLKDSFDALRIFRD